MDITGGAEKTSIEGKHLAAVLAPTIRKEHVPKDVTHLQKLLNDGKGKSVFEVKVAPKEDADVFANFTEMRQMIDTEDKASDRHKELSQKLNIYEKILNGKADQLGMDKDGQTGDPGERLEVLKVLGEIPGFAESMAIATGGSMTIEQATKYLQTGRGSIPAEHRKAVAEMIQKYIGDDELRIRLERKLSSLSADIPPEYDDWKLNLEKDKEKAKGKDALTKQRSDLEVHVKEFDSLPPELKSEAENIHSTVATLADNVKDSGLTTLTVSGVDDAKSLVKSRIDGLTTRMNELKLKKSTTTSTTGSKTKTSGQTERAEEAENNLYEEKKKLEAQDQQLTTLKSYLSNTRNADLLRVYNNSKAAVAKIDVLNKDIEQKEAAELEVKKTEGKINKFADKYKRKLERTLSDEMKRFWNEVKVEEAAQAGAEEAAEKKMLEEKAKTDAEKRAVKAREMLDHYLHLSFMKYKGGKEVGFDDKAIKNFMHKDMLSQSPAQLARTFMERIDSASGSMPPKYQEEIEALFKEMREIGVAKGEPPLSFDKMLDSISQKEYFDLAAKKVPDMLGYAWARGYYFDRMKLKKHEGMFLQEAYGKDADFFKAAAAGRDEQLAMAQKLLDEKVLAGLITPEQIEALIGKDWTDGGAKLMKLLAVGAGAYVLGGGLAFGFDKAGLALGAQHAANNLKGAGHLVGSTVQATSRLGNMALHGLVGNVANPPGDVGGVLGQLDKLMIDQPQFGTAPIGTPPPFLGNSPVALGQINQGLPQP